MLPTQLLPNSWNHVLYFSRSPVPTLFPTFWRATKKSSCVTASRSASLLSERYFCIAVRLSPCSLAFSITFRTLIMAASRETLAISAPEYPPVISLSISRLTSSESSVPFKLIRNNSFLPSMVGNGMYIRFSNRLRSASSNSQGVLVAPSTITVELLKEQSFSLDLEFLTLVTPSICTINSVLILRLASCSLEAPREPAMLSISSKKMVDGA
mmetsp:Transcript_14693/g.21700  ORF Transcript_14693/g.21700 Transcript_14693/m.21700 type:complete len:212 (+) Transcript_14693:337-972(+)